MLWTSLLRNDSTSFLQASLFFSFHGNLLLSIELAVSDIERMWYTLSHCCGSSTNSYIISFHDGTPWLMNIELTLGKKYGLAPYCATMEQAGLFEYRASPSAVFMPGQLMWVCERTDGNIRSSPTEWSGVDVAPPKILVWTPTDDSEYWKLCLEEGDDAGHVPAAAVGPSS